MTSKELHDEAMVLADHADTLLRLGHPVSAHSLYWWAYQSEAEAAARVGTHEPSRSVLYRSAAWLAIKAGNRDRARTLAASGLAGSPPSEIWRELMDVYDEASKKVMTEGPHTNTEVDANEER